MTGTFKKKAPQRERKSKSGLSSLKKKLNIPKIYKRLASKLSIHGRHIRSLTSTWNASDLHCLVSQYELTAMLKELSDAAQLARVCAHSITEDLLELQKTSQFCDLSLSCDVRTANNELVSNRSSKTLSVHSALFSKRTKIALPREQKTQQCESSVSQGEEVELAVDGESLGMIANIPSDVKYKYDEHLHRLTLVSDTSLPAALLRDWISYIYGEKSYGNAKVQQKCNKLSSMTTQPSSGALPSLLCHGSHENDTIKKEHADVINTTMIPDKNKPREATVTTHQQNEVEKFHDIFRSDMKDLLSSANVTGDIKLIFTFSCLLSTMSSHLRSRPPAMCCHAHSFVLASRSPYFRNIISKHKERNNVDEKNPAQLMTIEFDWKVFSPRYFPVVLYAMYTDEVDLQRIVNRGLSNSNLAEMESLTMQVKDLMEIIYIGRFLEFPILIQGCENALVEELNVSNLIEMLNWSSQPHGSPWLRRQIIRYAKENFQQLLGNGILFSLSSSELAEIIRSDFINAPELDVLRAVLKWGEHELLRRIELREPNLVRSHVLLNQATRNFRVSSTRRRELLMASNTDELHESTASLLTHVRLRHILPANHEVLTGAIKRGVVSCPPEHLLEWHHHSGASSDTENAFFWLRDRAGLGFSPPRLFMPHVAEAKVILEERLCQETAGAVNLKSVKRTTPSARNNAVVTSSAVPDALYMVNQVRRVSRPSSVHNASCEKCRFPRIGVTSLATKRLKYIDNRYPVPSPVVASKLLARERALRQMSWIRRILQACHSTSVAIAHCCCRSERNSMTRVDFTAGNGLLCNLCRAERYIRLLVVREHDLPDVVTDVLRRPNLYYDPDELFATTPTHSTDAFHVDVLVKAATCDRVTPVAPKRLQKLFHKKSMALNKSATLLPDVKPDWVTSDHGSSSDLSLSDDSSSEWPFPYAGVEMRGRDLPGSSFWGSDSSLRREIRRCVVPDVAASADSTLKSNHSRLSSSTSDSCGSVHCRLVAESRPEDDASYTSRGESFSSASGQSFSLTSRKTSVTSYAQYLSMKKTKSVKTGTSCGAAPLAQAETPRTLDSPVPLLVLEGTPHDNAVFPTPDLCAGNSPSCTDTAKLSSKREEEAPGSLFLNNPDEVQLCKPADKETCL